MNKAKFSTTLILLLLLVPVLALAAPTITETSVKVTADYGKFADEDDDFISISTQTFNIVSDVAKTVTIKAEGLPSGYNSNSQTINVEANITTPVTLTIQIPHSNEPGEEKIGTITIYDGSTSLDSADLVQETLSMLNLNELEVEYEDSDGRSKKDQFASNDNTYTLENGVKPFTEVTFTFELQNLFDRDYQDKGDLEELELTIDVDDEDLLVEGFQDTYNWENIGAGRELKQTVTLMIDDEVEPDTYTLEFTINAEDNEGIRYEIVKELQLEVELDDEDVRIVSAKLLPETVTTCDAEVTLTVDVHNFGSDDLEDVKVTLVNSELKINEVIENIALESHTEDDDSWLKTYTISLDDAVAKTYFLDLKTYIDTTLTDVEAVELSVSSCASQENVNNPEEEEEEQEETPVVVPPKNETAEQAEENTGIIKSIEKLAYSSNDYIIALVIVAIGVAAAMIVLLLIILLKKP